MRKRYQYVYPIAFLFFFLFVFRVVATEFPARSQNDYVVDNAQVLTREQATEINTLGTELRRGTGAEFVVAVLPESTGDLSEYATALFRKWGLGSATENNGLLLLVYPNEHLVRIEVGYGLEGAINDAKAGQVLDRYFVPLAKEEEVAEAILVTYFHLAELVADEYNYTLQAVPPRAPPVIEDRTEEIFSQDAFFGSKWGDLLFYTLFFLIFGISIIANIFDIGTTVSGGDRSSDSDRGGGSGGNSGGGGGSSGGGGADRGW